MGWTAYQLVQDFFHLMTSIFEIFWRDPTPQNKAEIPIKTRCMKGFQVYIQLETIHVGKYPIDGSFGYTKYGQCVSDIPLWLDRWWWLATYRWQIQSNFSP